MIEFLSQPWPWYVAGPIIAVIMFSLLFFGKSFGLSSNLRTMCSALGAGRKVPFFDFDWKKESWNLVFALGLVIGGFIAATWFMPSTAVGISEATIEELSAYGISDPGEAYVPIELFNWSSLGTAKGMILLVLGGFLIGFGTRYAGGCTSGHAISGLSNLQIASLVSVIGFFIGGIITIYLIYPFLLPT